MQIQMKEIMVSPVELRKVDTGTAEWHELVDSIRDRGLINPISVRPATEEDKAFWAEQGNDAEGINFVLVDGLHRFTACQACGFETVEAHVRDIDSNEALFDQFIANNARILTKPAEYAKQMHTILARNPEITYQDIADKLHISLETVKKRLKLSSLIPDAQVLVDSGEINLNKAYDLSRLPEDKQAELLPDAIGSVMSNEEFNIKVKEIQKEIRKAKRAGGKVEPVFTPRAKVRSKSDLEAALAQPNQFVSDELVEGFVEGIKFALSLDDETVEAARAAFNARIEAAKARKEAAKAKKAE